MNKLLSRDRENLEHGKSLMENQEKYRAPQNDCLSSFYESAQHSVNYCVNDKRRSDMIEDNYRKEGQKFSHDQARKSWVGGLRNEKLMYLQTTNNS